MSDENFELSEHQKQLILDLWNKAPSNDPPGLIQLVEAVWGPGTDPRSKKGREVRVFLTSRQLKPKLVRDSKCAKIELSDADKLYIKNNCITMKAFEMARVIFSNDRLSNLNAESRAVANYLATLTGPKVEDDIPLEIFKAPFSLAQTIARVNAYIPDEIPDPSKLSGKQRKDLKALQGCLQTFRFQNQINTFETNEERQLFESEFVRCTYDKNDLTQEEVDQYILYSTEVVIAKGILKRISTLERQQDDEINEAGKMNMAIVEAVKTLRQEYNACVRRQNDLLAALKLKRSERLSTEIKDNATILNLVQLFKEEETRITMIKFAQENQKENAEDIDKIANMDELKARILGISKEEALYG